ncbi:MAG TPA: hypothetical protein VFQ39_14540 [Longimicrobium sp.]|nr:hypothetical protein [Longimicrobium sp.]
MKKIRLDLDSLEINSFVAGGDAAERGTVRGHAVTEFVCSWLPSCPDQPTCGGKTC